MEADSRKPYFLRPYDATDLNFIQSSWGSSYYSGTNNHCLVDSTHFHKFHRPHREAILKRPTAAVLVACSKADPDLIIGWALVEKGINEKSTLLHYVYVKQAFKGERIATDLLSIIGQDQMVLYTHETVASKKILKRHIMKFERWRYTPHLI